MRRRIHSKLTYANVMSSVAVFLVLGGASAFAAQELATHSVGTAQLQRGSVTSAKVRDRSLRARDFARGLRATGLPTAYEARGSTGMSSISDQGWGTTIATLRLPPGPYYVSASLQVAPEETGTTAIICRIAHRARTLLIREVVTLVEEQANLSFSGTIGFSKGRAVRLRCASSGSPHVVAVPRANLVALELGERKR